jgi:hypothetical protein
MEYEQNFEHHPLVDALDHEILMHREVHFGGHFPTMIEYYREEKKGAQPEFRLEQIEKLAALEAEIGQNLAILFLAGSEMERVAEAKKFYKKLREIYEAENSKTPIPRLIADLILTEDEEAHAEIEAIVQQKEKIVPFLIDLLKNEELYDPLFPGYGQTPSLAVKSLGLIGDKRAIISLFESLGKGDFFADDQILEALKEIGEPAKKFLLRVVEGKPINEDNEKAAIALISFKDDDEEVAANSLRLLHDPDIQQDSCLATYLVFSCEGLKTPSQQAEFKSLSEDAKFKQLKTDMKIVIQGWKKQ